MARNITPSDARYMLKDYYSYDAILALSDNEIKDYLTNYYSLKTIYAKSLKVIEDDSVSISGTDCEDIPDGSYEGESRNIDGATYYWCNVYGYGADWFHADSDTHVGYNDLFYGSDTQDIWEIIYETTDSYSAANMWGTYSCANTGAHEGIDFNGDPEGQTLKAVATGDLGQRDSDWGLVGLSWTRDTGCEVYNFRAFYMHMENINTSPDIDKGNTIGTEGGVGPKGSNQFNKHLHFQVYHNHTQTYCNTSSDEILSSDSPYKIMTSDCI